MVQLMLMDRPARSDWTQLTRITMAARMRPSLAWLAVFVPALCYFLATRLTNKGFRLFGASSNLGQTVTHQIHVVGDCRQLEQVFYLSSSCSESKYGLQLVLQEPQLNIVATAWRHDSDLGRGYLLLSDNSGSGRIWRWEVGGGPIAIGRTLHLQQAGCRSNLVTQCLADDDLALHQQQDSSICTTTGSGGIAIDFLDHDRAAEGRLVIAEWGEQRIARLEENGARTPLVIQVPDLCHLNATRRVQAPHTLLYTPAGDLVFVDEQAPCQRSAVFRLEMAVLAPAQSSLHESRQAHEWLTTSLQTPEIVYESDTLIGGISLTSDAESLILSTVVDSSVVLISVPLVSGDDDDDDDDEDSVRQPREIYTLINVTQHDGSARLPGALAVSQQGHIFLSVEDGFLILERTHVLGKIQMNVFPTCLTLGEDGFLYVSTRSSLYRIAVRTKPIQMPTDKVRRLSKARQH